MKKIKTSLLSLLLCSILLCQVGGNLYSVAAEVNANTVDKVTAVELVRLKKYLLGMRSYVGDYDYDNSGKVDSVDLVVIRRLILGLPVDTNTDTEVKVPHIDKDGYYSQVVKP